MSNMAKKTTNKNRKQKSNHSIGFLFWIALILLVIVIALFNKEDLMLFFKNIKNKEPNSVEITTVPSSEVPPQKKEPRYETVEVPEKKSKAPEVVVVPKEKEKIPTKKPTLPQKEEKKAPEKTKSEITKKPLSPAKEEKIALIQQISNNSNKKYRNYKLYYVLPSDNNPLHLQAIVREIAFEDSPLTATLQSLFQGVKASEFKQFPEMISAIPQGSVIHSVKIEKGNAIINLNSAFTQNIFSKEGMEASLKQIIYTSTEFPSVDSVQILIDGKSQDYLGQEGIYIKKPLYRNSFR